MSRIGKLPVEIPGGVTVEVKDGSVHVKGSKGELSQVIPEHVTVKVEDSQVVVTRENDEKAARANQGLIRSLVNNMVEGVNNGFKKQLEVEGVGFKVNLAGKTLKLALGFSHEVQFAVPDDIQVTVDGNTITVEGASKQRVGQIASEIRAFKKPEPYKGKGIRYTDEYILRKAGKAAAGAGE